MGHHLDGDIDECGQVWRSHQRRSVVDGFALSIYYETVTPEISNESSANSKRCGVALQRKVDSGKTGSFIGSTANRH